jgi:hypothetical protein
MSISQRGLTLSLAVMAAFVAFTFVARHWMHGAGPWASLAVFAVAIVAAFGSTAVWWRGIDEAAREAHKSAWYWGGCAGLAVGFAVIVALPILHAEPPLLLNLKSSPSGYFFSGALGVVFTQIAGYAAAWAFWWARR